ncbi:MAG: cardiolipin synthase [Pseudomonadota bacterium]
MSISLTNWILILTHVVIAPLTATHAALSKRDSRSAFGWISVCILFPIAGPVIYAVFGLNRVRSRARRLNDDDDQHETWLHKVLDQERVTPALMTHSAVAAVANPPFDLSPIGARLSGVVVAPGNQLTPLINGDEAYPAMLEAIGNATTSVSLCSYIFDNDGIGRQFVDALSAARQRGAQVKVLVDGVGQHYSIPSIRRRLRKAGLMEATFMPPRLLPPSLHINLRNHRKILVVDGTVGFTGGMNISDRHITAQGGSVQDVHFRVAGPVVGALEHAFAKDWAFATNTAVTEPHDVTHSTDGTASCRVITDGPDEELDRLSMLINATVAAAKRQVLIMTPYFLPSRELVAVLQAAAVRGVEIRVVLPAENNLWFVHAATMNMLWELLQYGVAVHFQPPPFVHTKLLVIDDDYTLVGSANLDPRSLRLNFELGLEVFCKNFTGLAERHMRQCIDKSREVTLAEVESRSLPVRIRDATCWLFSPYL